MIPTQNPRTGEAAPTSLHPTEPREVREIAERASGAARQPRRDRRGLAVLLDAIADEVERRRADLVETADAETALGEARLMSEAARAAGQFRLFANVVREGSHLEAMIDRAGDGPAGRLPEVRRMLVPIGPVAVFGSSNFPFAFSVLGGDTASALAAGCPVVLKAHSSHPRTSALSLDVLQTAAGKCDHADLIAGIVYGQAAGSQLVQDPSIAAVGFTGSLSAAQALESAISQRPAPIPFYGELSSLNPLVVSQAAASVRADAIAEGLFASITGSAGQLCTKPGVVLIPHGPGGDRLVNALAERFRHAPGATVLNGRIRDSFHEIAGRLRAGHGGRVLAAATVDDARGFAVTPMLIEMDLPVVAESAEECFGPFAIVARYGDHGEIVDVVERMAASLTVTLHTVGEDPLLTVVPRLEPHAGRIVFDGYPTGVRVSWAQHHGGPWPATNTLHTSVGATSVRRFLRPVAWQDAPPSVLPLELRDEFDAIPRRIDGELHLAGSSAIRHGG
ncbi:MULTISPECIES: aldehyde dehydrogenase family protein [Microbacterium]|uniref:aldehyde dehydrogenase family protein n=1 Tax=Microbacterium TaxID=33882 RepID=UPI001469A6DB|nr:MULTISPECIES: aldehyde dehydrogenase family protein [Microbacterium]